MKLPILTFRPSFSLQVSDYAILAISAATAVTVVAWMFSAGLSSTPAPYDRAEAAALFRECLAKHPRTADIVIAQRSPVSTCLSAAVELATTTSTRSR